MKPQELRSYFALISRDIEKLNRLLDALDVLIEDYKFVRFSAHKYLPAARDYLKNKNNSNYRFKAARVRRARLGGSARWLYDHQKKTFEKVLNLLNPLPAKLPKYFVDWAWLKIKIAESRMLTRSRQNA